MSCSNPPVHLDMSAAGTLNPTQDAAICSFKGMFKDLKDDQHFRQELWRSRPQLLGSKEFVAGFFELERDVAPVVDSCEVQGYRVTDTVCWDYDEIYDSGAHPPWSTVRAALSEATIIFIGAGGVWRALGAVCATTQEAFELPANINVYISKPGLRVSAPVHTDSQDVFILQTQGAKHWRVFSPIWEPFYDPYSRGKLEDHLDPTQMGDPLIDITLEPGAVLFIPAGFPHCTDTALTEGDSTASVHLTLGLDTFVWGLSMAQLRWGALVRAGHQAGWDPEDVERALWDRLQQPMVGFVAADRDQGAAVERLCAELPGLMGGIEGAAEAAVIDEGLLREVVTRFIAHRDQIMRINAQLYSNQDHSRLGIEAAMRDAAIGHHAAIDGLIEYCVNGVERDDPDHMDFYFAYNGS